MAILGIFGAGGLARETLSVSKTSKVMESMKISKALLIDREEVLTKDSSLIMGEERFLRYDGDKYFCVGIADPVIRESIFLRQIKNSIPPLSIIANTAEFYDNVVVSEGSIVSSKVILGASVFIGCGCVINVGTYVAHDCNIGNFVTIGPQSCICGNVEIGDNSYIGAGVTIKQGSVGQPLKIGKNVTIGMGSVVLRDVPDNQTVFGNPAHQVIKK